MGEKVMFEWMKKHVYLDKSYESQVANGYFAQFFVEVARQGPDRNTDEQWIAEHNIFNYQPEFTGKDPKSYFSQVYFFNSSREISAPRKLAGNLGEERTFL